MTSEIRKEKKKKPPLGFSYTGNPLFLPECNNKKIKKLNCQVYKNGLDQPKSHFWQLA